MVAVVVVMVTRIQSRTDGRRGQMSTEWRQWPRAEAKGEQTKQRKKGRKKQKQRADKSKEKKKKNKNRKIRNSECILYNTTHFSFCVRCSLSLRCVVGTWLPRNLAQRLDSPSSHATTVTSPLCLSDCRLRRVHCERTASAIGPRSGRCSVCCSGGRVVV